MIKLSEDGKNFFDVTDWEELLTRPGFEQKVDSDDVEIGRIIGQYSITPKQPCGIKSCGTKHNRGYLITLSDGRETNIGNVCGRKIFKVDFSQHLNVFKKDMNSQRYREEIRFTQNTLLDTKDQVELLSKGDGQADDCYSQMNAQMTRLFSEDITRRLLDRAKRSNAVVTRDFEVTEDDRSSGVVGTNANYTTETVFIISGLSAVKSYKKLRTILKKQLGDELHAFEEINPDDLEFEDLKRWHNWINKIDLRLKSSRNIIQECNRFLQSVNIENIRKFCTYL
ncbi:MAG: hypothetical protein JAY64_19305 [Candidatus Thiodiazotropha weberae]|nr:hypothetical protein [Candidatus Thiodiazotropha lotti]MCG8013825.1 hypothetical protein [Candidatus Thiodiazotropha lotti]MCW4213306.1 hypothetical protein [Candidatus Thiodiazotropha lotti]MCW4217182.1 hypothetical protein [Candidatus Thiodiazotropha lotti]